MAKLTLEQKTNYLRMGLGMAGVSANPMTANTLALGEVATINNKILYE